ncbi:MAG: manganese efflux pump MntP family protein [Lachnospirales bacterium]
MVMLIALSVAMDAFGVSVVYQNSKYKPFHFGLYFGFAQSIMVILGFMFGSYFNEYFIRYGVLLSSLILFVLGGKMIYECMSSDDSSSKTMDNTNLFVLAIITSIDAYAVGLTFAITQVDLISSAIVIGLVTFALSYIGSHLGSKLEIIASRGEFLGGLVLILIGLKSLFLG